MSILKAALLGRSLPYSISPEVHRQLFEILQQKLQTQFDRIDYTKIECADEEAFRVFVRRGPSEDFMGFNVTFPYKYAAANMEGSTSECVNQIHSANTIFCRYPFQIISTDGNGFLFAMEKSIPNMVYSDYSLVLLGAGGAARAVLQAIYGFGWRQVTLAARSLGAARVAAESYGGVQAVVLREFKRDSGPQFIVQATPVGQRNSAESLLEDFGWSSGDIAADLVYNPLCTRFLDLAERAGAQILDGLGMLIEQAALSQYFWMTSTESKCSVLNAIEFQTLHTSLSKLLTPRWDASDT